MTLRARARLAAAAIVNDHHGCTAEFIEETIWRAIVEGNNDVLGRQRELERELVAARWTIQALQGELVRQGSGE